jgi:hypothetical protein
MSKKILILILTLLSFKLNAQKNAHLIIKGEPLYLFSNGLNIGIETPIGKSKWLLVSPQLYANYKGKQADLYDDEFHEGLFWKRKPYVKLVGCGLDLMIKNFVLSQNVMYFGYGTTWQYYNITREKLGWESVQEGDLNVLLPAPQNYTEQINKFGINGVIGFQTRTFKGLNFDIYSGWGIRYSICRAKNGPVEKFDTVIWDFGYSGITFLFGMRFGIAL